MKKSFLLVAILLAFNSLFADNLNVEQAREFGHKFVKANFEQKENNELDLVYTMHSESGEPCFYVFNVSDYGFIMVSATDIASIKSASVIFIKSSSNSLFCNCIREIINLA